MDDLNAGPMSFARATRGRATLTTKSAMCFGELLESGGLALFEEEDGRARSLNQTHLAFLRCSFEGVARCLNVAYHGGSSPLLVPAGRGPPTTSTRTPLSGPTSVVLTTTPSPKEEPTTPAAAAPAAAAYRYPVGHTQHPAFLAVQKGENYNWDSSTVEGGRCSASSVPASAATFPHPCPGSVNPLVPDTLWSCRCTPTTTEDLVVVFEYTKTCVQGRIDRPIPPTMEQLSRSARAALLFGVSHRSFIMLLALVVGSLL